MDDKHETDAEFLRRASHSFFYETGKLSSEEKMRYINFAKRGAAVPDEPQQDQVGGFEMIDIAKAALTKNNAHD